MHDALIGLGQAGTAYVGVIVGVVLAGWVAGRVLNRCADP